MSNSILPNLFFKNHLLLIFSELALFFSGFFIFSFYFLFKHYYSKKDTTLVFLNNNLRKQILLILFLYFFGKIYNRIGEHQITIFLNFFNLTEITEFLKISLSFIVFVILFLSKNYLKDIKVNTLEYYLFFIINTFSSLLLINSLDFISFYITLEIQSITLYLLISLLTKNAYSAESSLKYFITGGVTSLFLLFSIALIYGITGTTNFEDLRLLLSCSNWNSLLFIAFIFLLSTFFFKLALVPFHNWSPDVFVGSNSSLIFLLAIVPKIIFFYFFLKFYFVWFSELHFEINNYIVIVLTSSLVWGSFMMLLQTNFKRFIAYSSIIQTSYVLTGIYLNTFAGLFAALLYYFFYLVSTYSLMNFILLNKNFRGPLNNLGYLKKHNFILFLLLSIILLSLMGLPPITGWWLKLYVITPVAGDTNYLILGSLLIASLVSAFYYLKIVKIMIYDRQSSFNWITLSSTNNTLIILNIILSLFIVISFIFCYNFYYEIMEYITFKLLEMI